VADASCSRTQTGGFPQAGKGSYRPILLKNSVVFQKGRFVTKSWVMRRLLRQVERVNFVQKRFSRPNFFAENLVAEFFNRIDPFPPIITVCY
jgi:hypothetical protein